MTWRDAFAWCTRDGEVDDEVESHLQLAIQDRIDAGESPADARRAARLELGNVPVVKEDARAVWRWGWVDAIRRDVAHGARGMRRQPGFTAVAVATLAIGIGANAAIFSLVNAVLLRPLLVPDADRLVRFVRFPPDGRPSPTTSLPLANLLLQEAGVFRDMSAHRLDLVNLTGTPEPEQIAVARVTKDFFRLFGAPVLAGRTFAAEEDRPSGGRVTVLSYELWVRQFGADPAIVGTSISLGSEPYVVVGVLGPGFDTEQFDQVPQIWVPFQLDPSSRDAGGAFCFLTAKLTPGVSLAEANAQLRTFAANYVHAHPGTDSRFVSFSVEPVTAGIARAVRSSFTVLEVAVVLVLLIACANVANLLLMRGTGRAREMAVRAALGAGRGRLLRQLAAEALLLAAAGAVCGLVLGFAGLRGLLLLYPDRNPTLLANTGVHLPRIGEHGSAVTLDWRIVLFTVGVSVLASVIAALIPALHASRPDLQLGLKQTGGGTFTGARHQARTRRLLVIAELAIALMLVIGAGLLIRTSFALRAVQPGFDAQHVLTMRMSVSGTPFETREGIARLTRDAQHRMVEVPGVEVASMACCMPLESVWQLPFVVQGRPLTGAFHAFAGWTFISPGYFDVFKIPVVRGRDFTERDDASAPGVVIINQEMARLFWPTSDPLSDHLIIGRGVRPDYNEDPIRHIVGIVGNVRDQALRLNPRPAMYVPVAQVPDGVTVLNVQLLPLVWVVRTRGDPHAIGPAIAREIQQASRGLPIARVRSMSEVVSESTARGQFDMWLMAVFAASALVLATVGIYGLMAYAVAQRTREIGLRLALGAGPGDVRHMILRQGMMLAGLGITIGMAASLSITRLMESVLFSVSPRDPAIFVGVPLFMVGVAWCAVWVPARHAIRISPMNALRHE